MPRERSRSLRTAWTDHGFEPPRAGCSTVPAGRPVQIKVLTQPETATLYDASGYRGPGGAHLSEPFGTKLEVKCRQPGYKDGSVKLVFDGKQEAALCVLQRIVVCIPGVKNPFDNCPE
jgi:hypothetical protein